jgi:hypothetical protein
VLESENGDLILSLMEKEVDEVLASMKVDTTLGPDGLPVIFFKCF